MLAELSIDNLVLIAEARLRLSPGLNVITGETGAGKTLLAQAIGLLMGQKGGDELVRQGADRAVVQALFERGDESLAVARELPRGGRSRARLDGLLSSAAAVEEALRDRVAFYGQLEQAKLLHLERQLDLLDAAGGAELAKLVAAYSGAFARARDLQRDVDSLRAEGHERAREIDMLRFQVTEIETAQLEPGEDGRLAAERERLRHAAKLVERAGGAFALLSGDEDSAALDALRAARRLLAEAAGLDAGLGAQADRLDALTAEVEDVAVALQGYLDELDLDPAHRDALEVRHDKLQTLKRKYGATVDEVLEYGAQAGRRLAALERFDADEATLAGELAAAQGEALATGERLAKARRRLAPAFAARVQDELRQLAMPHARFEVAFTARGEGFAGLGPRGADEVEFLFSANPGVPLRGLRETASGGELSRAMLALKSIVTLGDDVETLIFDEVDTGIGGVTATALGERLGRLAGQTQIVCITHLPQVVAHADRHFAIRKKSDAAAGVTETVIAEVSGEERLDELCRMLGAVPNDAAARAHAARLLVAAERGPSAPRKQPG
jgi:DNA repair protein RecN (Recombination protein N)